MTKPNQIAEELSVFESFVKHYPAKVTDIETRRPPEPDIRCESDGIILAFELVELIDEDFARAISGMLNLKAQYEGAFKSLSGDLRSRLQALLTNAAVFVTYQEGATLHQRQSIIPIVFNVLESIRPTDTGNFQTDSVSPLKSVVKMVRILRGDFNGPSWNITTAGLLDDLPIKRILDKFSKKFSSDAGRIELLAYFDSQPAPVPEFIPLMENTVRTQIALSQFSAVWIYSRASDKIISHIMK